jgi:membrane-bound lytic murein transglycosylase B
MGHRRCALISALLGMFAIVSPAIAVESDADPAAFTRFLDGVRQDALQRGLKPATVQAALAGVKPIRRIIQRDRSQAEFTLTLETYRGRVVTPQTVAKGQQMAVKHRALLDAVSRRYHVQPRFILAIWGIETRFGSVKATVPLIPALATLAFDARRPQFFRGQLLDALTILDRGYIGLDRLLGSWAGAMGQPQFMPSSYLAYAQDFDGDGKRDIWQDPGDIFASIANYLAQHGWRDDLTWGRAVRLPAKIDESRIALSQNAAPACRAMTTESRRLSQWESLGVRQADGDPLPSRDVEASLVLPDGRTGPAFLVYANYAAIMAYNCAHLYAVTVGTLADRIGAVPNG